MNACLRHLSRALAWALSCALLASCQSGPRAPTIRLEQVAQMAPGLPGATPRWQQAEPAEAGVRVFRQGQPMVASRGMLLQAGDVVETGPRSGATVRFSGATGGTVTLDENTRARVGST